MLFQLFSLYWILWGYGALPDRQLGQKSEKAIVHRIAIVQIINVRRKTIIFMIIILRPLILTHTFDKIISFTKRLHKRKRLGVGCVMLDILTQFVFTIGKNNGSFIEMLGTGFLVDNCRYIVTPRHVVGDDDNGLVIILPSIHSFDEYQDTTVNNCSYANVRIKHSDPFRDLVLLEFVDQTIANAIATIPLGSTDDVHVGDEICIFGFPHCVEGRRVLTYQTALIGAKILIDSAGVKSKYCVINTQTRPGQSGSLIYSKTHHKIIAVLIGAFAPSAGISLGGINPRELHQTTQCLSAEYISAMIGG